jgi:hypothetical protein
MRKYKNVYFLVFLLSLCSISRATTAATTAGGSCPTGSNYVNVAKEGQSGTFNVTLASLGVTSCFYVGVSGSDSNAGTSESAPFLHIPGTPKFTGNATLGAGVGIIVQGGYVAHFGATTSPATGGSLTIKTGGSSGKPLYYGIDTTWYSGSSFTRPVLTGDNPLSTGFVSSCTYDNSSLGNLITVSSGASYVILDGFESTGFCWASGTPNVVSTQTANQYVYLERWYRHGWTTVSTSTDSSYLWWDDGAAADNDIIALNVVDGSDSSAGATGSSSCHWNSTNPCYSGGALYEGAYIVWGNVFQHMTNVAVTTNDVKWHDNYINNLSNSYQNDGQHTNCNNELGGVNGQNNYFYNNLTTNDFATECYYLTTSSGNTLYGFNNVFWGNMNYLTNKAPANCVFFNNFDSSGSQTVYWTNNTVDYSGGNGGGCMVQFAPSNSPLFAFDGSGTLENTDAIGYSNFASLYDISSGAAAAVTDGGGEVYETETTANSQGYTTGDNYAPTSASGATHSAGKDLSTLCSAIPDAAAAAACAMSTTGSVALTSGWGGEVASYPAITPHARGSSWDAGAYQFSTAPSSPQSLAGTIITAQ